MAGTSASSCHLSSLPKSFIPSAASFNCRPTAANHGPSSPRLNKPSADLRPAASAPLHQLGLSSALILRFPPNFVRQLSTKARHIGVAQIVAASRANNNNPAPSPSAANDGPLAAVSLAADVAAVALNGDGSLVQSADGSKAAAPASAIFGSDGSLAVHAGERFGRRIVTDGITTPIVNTSTYWFKNSDELLDIKEGRHVSYEYGRYGNPTTAVVEEKMSALERAETTLFMASGMNAAVCTISALVPAGGHMVTTTDCYQYTRKYIENELPQKGITTTVIDPADVDSLKTALDTHNVSLFYTETPTNPFFRCVDIKLVSELCHSKGAVVCIDSTFASPVNQKALTLGADIVLHSATKFIAGHNDVLGGCISGSEKLISKVRLYHNVVGGVLNPVSAHESGFHF